VSRGRRGPAHGPAYEGQKPYVVKWRLGDDDPWQTFETYSRHEAARRAFTLKQQGYEVKLELPEG